MVTAQYFQTLSVSVWSSVWLHNYEQRGWIMDPPMNPTPTQTHTCVYTKAAADEPSGSARPVESHLVSRALMAWLNLMLVHVSVKTSKRGSEEFSAEVLARQQSVDELWHHWLYVVTCKHVAPMRNRGSVGLKCGCVSFFLLLAAVW